jgi:hypothetical protein
MMVFHGTLNMAEKQQELLEHFVSRKNSLEMIFIVEKIDSDS